ncbi:sugar phosphate isomerase/epimerase family protein [Aquabacterium sp.]|uniref:sugar phosphate isomerase/epimerase family protein n=1 Tax=Aquabacterium sp. TaxID=1872578 RepID=UPI002B7C420B|nr:sugar phosphate isomerase/epimerase [Aquabacterium sp.]HSW08793.1 sugar phosphate isomerase/epimerase [Aquabacterium sp.]
MDTAHEDFARQQQPARLSRRSLLRTAAATAAAVGSASALSAPSPAAPQAPAGSPQGGGGHKIPPDRISIQLYTLREQIAADLEGTLAALREIGYTRVEHAGFAGRTAANFKAVLNANAIVATSGHVLIPQPFDSAAWSASLADARTLGSSHIVHPYFGINFSTGEVLRTTTPWRDFARDLNRAGRMARDAGVKLGYHNHNWEFFRLTDNPSRTAYDVLVETIDPDLVHLELDLFWATRAARDPVDLIQQNKGRILQFHVKDLNQAGSFADLGKGLIDFPRIFEQSKAAGVLEYIVERDDAGANALATARAGYDFLASIRF